MSEKFEKPYLVVTVKYSTMDMSVGNSERQDYFIPVDQLLPGGKLPKCDGVRLYGDYNVLEVGEDAIRLGSSGKEFLIKRDDKPGEGRSCGGRNQGGVWTETLDIFEYRTPLSRHEINKIPEMALDVAELPKKDFLEKREGRMRVLGFIERAVYEGNAGMYVALALLEASDDWGTCKIDRPDVFREIFTKGLQENALAPNIENPAWDWMEVAIKNNDPSEFADDMDLYYDALATASGNGVWLARDIVDIIWEPENCQEED